MKLVNLGLCVIFLLLQYRYWFGHNGVEFYNDNRQEVSKLRERNKALQKRNELLEADIQDLKVGTEGIEERARNELGMVRENETFFRVIPKTPKP